MEFRTQDPEKALNIAQAAVRACIPFSYCDIEKSYSFSFDCEKGVFIKIFGKFLPKDVMSWSPGGKDDTYRPEIQNAHLQIITENVKAAQLWADIMNWNQERAIRLTNILTFYKGNYLSDFDWTPEERQFVTLIRDKVATYDLPKE